MSSAFPNVLPVLRTPETARRDRETYHAEIPGDRVGSTPLAAFTIGRGLLSCAEVAQSGMSSEEMVTKAIANLEARGASWNVEEKTGGFLGLGKKPAVLSYTDEFAAEQLLVGSFLREAHHMLSPDDVRTSKTAFFVPKRGQIRAIAAETKDGKPTPYVERERGLAMQAWAGAGESAVHPAMVRLSSTVGDTVTIASRFAGTETPYLPLAENVRLMVLQKEMLTYLANASTAPKRELAKDLFLALGVRDMNGKQTPLPAETLNELGIPFEESLDRMIAGIPALPIVDMGVLRTGQPVRGFRGTGAIDQLASQQSLVRLHAMLGDELVVHVYSHGRVAATTADAPRTAAMVFDIVELCDPRQRGVIMTRGSLGYELYIVSGGKITGSTTCKPG